MSALKYVQSPTLYLAGSGVIIGATSIVLTNLTDVYGNVLTMTDFGGKGYITLEPDTSNEEAATFTGVVANANGTYTLTGVSTALAKSPYTETSGLIRQHSGGTKVVVTDNVAFWSQFANLRNSNTFDTLPQSAATPSANADFATKVYVDGVAVAGAPNASTIVKGIVELATQAETDARTTTGGTGALLVPTPDTQRSTQLSDYVASDTGTANAYAIAPTPAITAYAAGQTFTFKAAHTNTTVSTIAVSGLTTKAIKKLDGATALAAGDIVAGQVIHLEYDGTNFQMVNPSAVAPISLDANSKIATSNLYFNYQEFTASGTWTKPTGLTGTETVRVQMWGSGAGGGGATNNSSSAGAGGGGGAFVQADFKAADLGGTVTVTVPAGGAGGVGNAAGGSPAAVTFGSLLTANSGSGGAQGSGGNGAAGAGGTASTGAPIAIAGQAGAAGGASAPGAILTAGPGGGGGAAGASTGSGGGTNTIYAIGVGGAGNLSSNAKGENATGNGAGGGGAGSNGNTETGGNGSIGIVRVWVLI